MQKPKRPNHVTVTRRDKFYTSSVSIPTPVKTIERANCLFNSTVSNKISILTRHRSFYDWRTGTIVRFAIAMQCSVKMDRKALEFSKDGEEPGPAAYGTKTTVGRTNRMITVTNPPAYTIRQRLDQVEPEFKSPGPVYNVQLITNRGKAWAPKYSIGMKLPMMAETDTPGPAVYKPNTDRKPRLKILLPLKDVDPVSVYDPFSFSSCSPGRGDGLSGDFAVGSATAPTVARVKHEI